MQVRVADTILSAWTTAGARLIRVEGRLQACLLVLQVGCHAADHAFGCWRDWGVVVMTGGGGGGERSCRVVASRHTSRARLDCWLSRCIHVRYRQCLQLRPNADNADAVSRSAAVPRHRASRHDFRELEEVAAEHLNAGDVSDEVQLFVL